MLKIPTLLAITSLATHYLIAQVEVNATPTTIVGAFIAVSGSLVILVGWLVKHIFMTTIPSILKDAEDQRNKHSEEQKAQRLANEKALTEISTAYRAESNQERILCKEQFSLMHAALTGLTSAINNDREHTLASVKSFIIEATAAYRHDIRDVVNQAVLTRDMYLAQKMAEQNRAKADGAIP